MSDDLMNKIIKDQLEKRGLHGLDNPKRGVNSMSDKKIYEELTADFPTEAYSKDSSRGFDLTSIKAQYVVDRLNQVFGIMNWSHTGEYKETEGGVLFMGTLTVTVDTEDGPKTNRQMSVGYSADKKNIGDAYKSAKTDSLSKSASMYGVGDSVFKGKINPNGTSKSTGSVVTLAASKEQNEASGASKSPASFKTRTRNKIQVNGSADDGI